MTSFATSYDARVRTYVKVFSIVSGIKLRASSSVSNGKDIQQLRVSIFHP